jgi:hypothetical protein
MTRKTAKKSPVASVELDSNENMIDVNVVFVDDANNAPVTPVVAINETVAPVATIAHGDKWKATVAKARAAFDGGKAFREGSNRAVAYALLTSDEGATVERYRANIRNSNRPESSLLVEFSDVATISQRKLVKEIVDGVKTYRLASRVSAVNAA